MFTWWRWCHWLLQLQIYQCIRLNSTERTRTSIFIPFGSDSRRTMYSDFSRRGSWNCSAISLSFCLWSIAIVSEKRRVSLMATGCSVLTTSTVLLVNFSTPSSSDEDGTETANTAVSFLTASTHTKRRFIANKRWQTCGKEKLITKHSKIKVKVQ